MPINLVTADLGRHLRNGELLLGGQFDVLRQNVYSYTAPEFPVMNHHWGTGILFFLIWKLGGWMGLHLAFLALSAAALALLLRRALACSPAGVVACVFLLLSPVLIERHEIRPEAFSNLFAAVFLWRLWRVRDDGTPPRSLWWLPALEVLWVNAHIYFFLGPLLISAFLLEAAAGRGRIRPLAIALGATVAASLINPFGVRGALAPLTVFDNYAYRLVENQSVWFLDRVLPRPELWWFKLGFGMLALSLGAAWLLRRRRVWRAETFLAVGASLMGWLALRNFTFFALIALPVTADALGSVLPPRERTGRWLDRAGFAGAWVAFLLILGRIGLPAWYASPLRGLGLAPGIERCAQFVRDAGVTGPIFNNYDIGGYLIFELYPAHRVFVDNRPAEYPGSFFTETYVPMQEDDAVWRREAARHRFDAIIFYRHDFTPWGQRFLIARVQDADWAPVFVDDYTIVFVRRGPRNAELIRRHELPRSIFHVTSPRSPS